MRTMIDKLYDRLGYRMSENEKHLNIFLRKMVVEWACKLDHPECLKETKSQYKKWMNMSNPDIDNPLVACIFEMLNSKISNISI